MWVSLVLIVDTEKARMLSLEMGWGMEHLARVGRAAGRATLRHRAIEAILCM